MTNTTGLMAELTQGVTQERAFEILDTLEPVSLDFMLGEWKGSEVISKHPMDGLLSGLNWYGKVFNSSEEVHPLVFSEEGATFSIDPVQVVNATEPNFELIKSAKTEESKARIRMTEYRGKVSATMLYDQLPINDIFRKLDENTIFGVMDLKGPLHDSGYFFMLKRV